MSTQFLRKASVASRYAINVRSVDRWVRDGRLPPPIHRGRTPLWSEEELNTADREATRASRPADTNA